METPADNKNLQPTLVSRGRDASGLPAYVVELTEPTLADAKIAGVRSRKPGAGAKEPPGQWLWEKGYSPDIRIKSEDLAKWGPSNEMFESTKPGDEPGQDDRVAMRTHEPLSKPEWGLR